MSAFSSYISTRGGVAPVNFAQAVMMGLADDGGLLLSRELDPDLAQDLALRGRNLAPHWHLHPALENRAVGERRAELERGEGGKRRGDGGEREDQTN